MLQDAAIPTSRLQEVSQMQDCIRVAHLLPYDGLAGTWRWPHRPTMPSRWSASILFAITHSDAPLFLGTAGCLSHEIVKLNPSGLQSIVEVLHTAGKAHQNAILLLGLDFGPWCCDHLSLHHAGFVLGAFGWPTLFRHRRRRRRARCTRCPACRWHDRTIHGTLL